MTEDTDTTTDHDDGAAPTADHTDDTAPTADHTDESPGHERTPDADGGGRDEPHLDHGERRSDHAESERDRRELKRDRPERDRNGGRGPRRTVLWVALVGLGLFSLVMLFQFYASATHAIGDWVGPAYRSLVRTAFALLLLCLSLLGVAYVTRELTSAGE